MTEFKVQRRVHAQGGSYLIALPKLWADAKELRGGSLVEICFNGIVEIRPADTDGNAPVSSLKKKGQGPPSRSRHRSSFAPHGAHHGLG